MFVCKSRSNYPNETFVSFCEYDHDDAPINGSNGDKPTLGAGMGRIEDLQVVITRFKELARFNKRQAMSSLIASIFDVIPFKLH